MESVTLRKYKKQIAVGSVLNSFILQSAVALTGFLASVASFEGLTPFGVAVVSGIHTLYIPAAVLGAAAGSFYLYGVTVLTLRYVAAAVIAGVIAYMLKRSIKKKYHGYFTLIASFFSILATGLVLSMSITISADEFILYTAESIGCAVVSWFFFKVVNISFRNRSIFRYAPCETAGVLILFCILMLSLANFRFLVFMPDIAAGVFVVLTAAYYGGDRFGAIFGITAGTVLGLTGNGAFLTGGVALGGLLCGMCSSFPRFAATVVFLICTGLTAFAAEDGISALNIMYNVLFSASVFAVLPKRVSAFFKSFFAAACDGAAVPGQREVLRSRLRTAADGMKDVTSSVKAVAGIYRRRTMPREENIYSNITRKVCNECENYNQCLNVNYNRTMSWFARIGDSLKRCPDPLKGELPHDFSSTCIMQNKIINELSYEIECYRTAMRECAKTGETVNIVADQFASVSRLLEGFSSDMENGDEYDINRTGIVYDIIMNEIKKEPLCCGVFRNENRKLFCETSFTECDKEDAHNIVRAVSYGLGMAFEEPVVRKLTDGTVNVIFCERTRYSVESGIRQISSGGGKWCGDTTDSFYDGKGNFIMVLSDGMGTGQKAAADSVLCCSLASLLLRSGYPVDCILAMVNAAMLVRSGEESLATLDIAVINLYTGDVDFYKAGASFSVAMKKFRLLKIEKPSLPVGILSEVMFETVTLNAGDSDVIVLMSDGVTDDVLSVWRDILRTSADYSGNELAARLSETAFMNCGKENADDITVMIAAVKDKQ